MYSQKGEARTQPGIEANGSDYGAATRSDAHVFPFVEPVTRPIFRGKIERLVAAEGGTVALGLHAGVVGIEAAPGGQTDGIVIVKLVDGRFELDCAEWRVRTDERSLPEAAVQIHLARMRLVVAGPLDTTELLQTAVAHTRVHRTQLAHFVPDTFRVRLTPIVAKTAR